VVLGLYILANFVYLLALPLHGGSAWGDHRGARHSICF